MWLTNGDGSGGLLRTERGDELTVSARVNAQVSRYVPLQLGGTATETGIEPVPGTTVLVTTQLRWDLTFGLENPSDDLLSSFFVRSQDFIVSAQIDESARDLQLRIGMLGAEVQDADLRLDSALRVTLEDSIPDTEATLALSDLQQATADSFAQGTVLRDDLDIRLPVHAQVGTFSTAGTSPLLTFRSDDVFSGVTPEMSFNADFGVIQPFGWTTTTELHEMLRDIQTLLTENVDRLSNGSKIPFLQNRTVDNLFPLDAIFASRVLNSSTSSDGLPNYQTVQELLSRLGNVMTVTAQLAPQSGLFRLKLDIEALVSTFYDTLSFDLPTLAMAPLYGVTTSDGATSEAYADVTTDLVIDLRAAADESADDHYYLENSDFGGRVTSTASGVDAAGKYGYLGVHSTEGHGNSLFEVFIDQLPDKIYVGQEIPQGSTGIGGNATYELAHFEPDQALFTVTGNPRAQINWSDLGNPSTLDVDFVTFPEWRCFNIYQYLAYEDLVTALDKASSFLDSVAAVSAAGIGLPVIGAPISQFIRLTDLFSKEVDKLPPTPTDTVQRWEALLEQKWGLPADHVALTFNCDQVEIMVQFPKSSLPTTNIPLNLPLGSYGLAGTGYLNLDLSHEFKLEVGIDLTSSPAKYYLGDGTEVKLDWRVAGSGQYEASVGMLGVRADGQIVVDADGELGTSDPASLKISLEDADGTPDGRHDLGSAIRPGTHSVSTGRGYVQLDLFDALTGAPLGTPNRYAYDFSLNYPPASPPELSAPDSPPSGPPDQLSDFADFAKIHIISEPQFDFGSYFANLALFSQKQAFVNGVDSLLGKIDSGLRTTVLSRRLPLIGNGLSGLGDFVSGLRSQIRNNLLSQPDLTPDIIRDTLYSALGPTGLQWLNAPTDITIPTNSGDRVEFSLNLKKSLATNQSANIDLGLDSLGLQIDGAIQADVDVQWNLGIGFSKQDGVYFKQSSAGDLKVLLTVDAPGLSAAGQLGFLGLAVTDQGSKLQGTIVVNLVDPNQDGKLRFAELARSSVQGKLSGGAQVRLNLMSAVAGTSMQLPTVQTDFVMDWNFNQTSMAASSAQFGTISRLEFTNYRIDAGEVVSGFLAPVFNELDKVLSPIRPTIDLLTTPLPVLSDLPPLVTMLGGTGGQVRLVDVAAKFGGAGGQSARTFVDAVADTLKFIDRFGSYSAPTGQQRLWVNMGAFDLGGADPRARGFQLAKVAPRVTVVSNPLAANNSATAEINAARGELQFTERGLRIPIIEQPLSAFKLLMGQPVDLVQYGLPLMTADVTVKGPQFPIYPPIMGEISGSIQLVADLSLGFDTSGFDAYRAGGYQDPNRIFDGLYLINSSGPEFKVSSTVQLAAVTGIDVDFGIATVTLKPEVAGGVQATMDLNFHEVQPDGKMRLSELRNRASSGPLCIFDVEGGISAFLTASVEASVSVGRSPFDYDVTLIDESYELARVQLMDFSGGCTAQPTEELAKVVDGILIVDTTDDDDRISITPGRSAGEVEVHARGLSKTYSGFTRIMVDGKSGKDSISVSAGVAFDAELIGGAGNDTLRYQGNGRATLRGGDDDDVLYAGPGNDSLYGEGGHDSLMGGPGNDTLDGGLGDDTLNGGDGNDDLYGQGDNDSLAGSTGDDRLYGGTERID